MQIDVQFSLAFVRLALCCVVGPVLGFVFLPASMPSEKHQIWEKVMKACPMYFFCWEWFSNE